MFTYLYEFILTSGQKKQVVATSNVSELDAYAKAFSQLSTAERDNFSEAKLKTIAMQR